MAKGHYLSGHQKGIVKRYYEHLDTLTLSKLQEAVTDLYLAPKGTDGGRTARKWKSVLETLIKAGVGRAAAEEVVATRNVEALASLVARLAAGSGRR